MYLKSVLIVEDDTRLRSIIARNLELLGYMVFEAGTFREATEQMVIKPSLLLLDITLPDATGWDLAGWLESFIAPPPIIVISGTKPDVKKLRHFQPVAFLPKPFAIGELLTLVKKQLPLATGVAG